jgi:pimeloyl-ACP methyl ester carboxylesterase
LTWYALTISAWMDAIGVQTAHICGHSFGGGIAQWMLLDHRKRVDRLALVAPGGLGREAGMGLRFATFPLLGRALTPFVIRHFLPFVVRHASATFAYTEPDEVERAVAMNRIPGTDRAFQRSVEAVINFSGQHVRTKDRVREVPSLPPIALFWGEKDPIIPVRHGREAFKGSTGVTLTTYPESGHFPHLDAPFDFSRDLRAFLCDPHRPLARMRPAARVAGAEPRDLDAVRRGNGETPAADPPPDRQLAAGRRSSTAPAA